ncbi:uncharacterized protein TRAVEDRAFT_19466 [Trametes versicolor FP-101664 SS1]|uniref:uncharacterized protein n=1 Tax=Trametes versicolor (strain FP-101664) TaxID=717944 RepID=UPI0004623E47|nr:uncharacterized protein TRAVEDRAFT_19466 [Trametes versicolor FP-101664 SS1]EIW60938.1 hypothetical protein TRAVEDRAFT_19466 [Trametes versicolor FP-101664 SS1]
MKFLNVLPAIGALVLGALSVVAQDAAVIITGITQVTDASSNLKTIVDKVTIANAPSQAAKIAPGLLTIGNTCRELTKAITVPDPKPFGDDVAGDIVDVLVTFVEVHQALLNAIIGKHGIIANIPFVGPDIAAALRGLEAIVDALAFAIIGLIPTRQNPAMAQIASLDKTFADVIRVYSS